MTTQCEKEELLRKWRVNGALVFCTQIPIPAEPRFSAH